MGFWKVLSEMWLFNHLFGNHRHNIDLYSHHTGLIHDDEDDCDCNCDCHNSYSSPFDNYDSPHDDYDCDLSHDDMNDF